MMIPSLSSIALSTAASAVAEARETPAVALAERLKNEQAKRYDDLTKSLSREEIRWDALSLEDQTFYMNESGRRWAVTQFIERLFYDEDSPLNEEPEY